MKENNNTRLQLLLILLITNSPLAAKASFHSIGSTGEMCLLKEKTIFCLKHKNNVLNQNILFLLSCRKQKSEVSI